MKYLISVTQNVKDSELHHEDKLTNPAGVYEIKANTESQALDEFHATIPISCLENFEIEIEEL